MEYAILDELWNLSQSRYDDYCNKNNVYLISKIEEVEEPWQGSSPNLRLFVFYNFIGKTSNMDLAIIIREVPNGKIDDFDLNQVESSILPLYCLKSDAFDIPPNEDIPEFKQDDLKFIIDKRSLPKRKKGEDFNPEKHKWDVNKIAEARNLSNRRVAQFCRAKNI